LGACFSGAGAARVAGTAVSLAARLGTKPAGWSTSVMFSVWSGRMIMRANRSVAVMALTFRLCGFER
jgi:hypothetical protein